MFWMQLIVIEAQIEVQNGDALGVWIGSPWLLAILAIHAAPKRFGFGMSTSSFFSSFNLQWIIWCIVYCSWITTINSKMLEAQRSVDKHDIIDNARVKWSGIKKWDIKTSATQHLWSLIQEEVLLAN